MALSARRRVTGEENFPLFNGEAIKGSPIQMPSQNMHRAYVFLIRTALHKSVSHALFTLFDDDGVFPPGKF